MLKYHVPGGQRVSDIAVATSFSVLRIGMKSLHYNTIHLDNAMKLIVREI